MTRVRRAQELTCPHVICPFQTADKDICKLLKAKGRLIVHVVLNHSYPFCWRSGTPLLYKAIPVWMVKVEEYRDRLVANNDKTRWSVTSWLLLLQARKRS